MQQTNDPSQNRNDSFPARAHEKLQCIHDHLSPLHEPIEASENVTHTAQRLLDFGGQEHGAHTDGLQAHKHEAHKHLGSGALVGAGAFVGAV